MGGAEGVVDVAVGQAGQGRAQVVVSLGLARFEAQVLEHHHRLRRRAAPAMAVA